MAQFIPGINNNFYYNILGYFWGVTACMYIDMNEMMYGSHMQVM